MRYETTEFAEKPKGIPRAFWQKHGERIRGWMIFFAVVAVAIVIGTGVYLLAETSQQDRHGAIVRDARNAMFVCISNHDGERDLLVCMEQAGFTVTWDLENETVAGVTVDEYWPESDQP